MYKRILVLIILSYLFFMFGNGILGLSNPDEVFYAQTAKEMVKNNTWTVPYLFGEPQFEKPILTYWLIRIGFILFGISDFGARFFSALLGIIGVIGVYFFAFNAYKDEKKAFICALILMSSAVYTGMSRIILTDVIFSVFILLSLLSFFCAYIRTIKKNMGIILFYVFSALAVLTKGPIGFLVPLAVVVLFLALKRELKFFFCASSFWGALMFLIISCPWYVFVIKKYGNAFMREFIYNDHIRRIFEAEHKRNDTWYFYPLSMIYGMFPWCAYIVVSFVFFYKKLKEKNAQPIYLFAACWIFVVLAIFLPAHSKLISYILPLYPVLSLIAGDFIYSSVATGRKRLLSVLGFISWFALLLFPVILILCPEKYSAYLPPKAVLYAYVVVYMIPMFVSLIFIIKRKFIAVVYMFTLQLLVFMFFVPAAHKNLDTYLSSKAVGEYLTKEESVTGKIVCSKQFIRGVLYYTGKETVVWGKDFFSPHPIIHLDSDEKVIDFFKTQPVTYCVITESSFGDIEQIAGTNFKYTLLKIVGDEYIIKILPY